QRRTQLYCLQTFQRPCACDLTPIRLGFVPPRLPSCRRGAHVAKGGSGFNVAPGPSARQPFRFVARLSTAGGPPQSTRRNAETIRPGSAKHLNSHPSAAARPPASTRKNPATSYSIRFPPHPAKVPPTV